MHSRPMRNISSSMHVGAFDALQRVGHHDEIEAVAGEIRQTLIEVLLDDVDAGRDATGDHLRIDLEAVSVDAFRAPQMSEQFAVAATEVEHARVGGDEIGDDRDVGSHHAFDRVRRRVADTRVSTLK